MYEVRDKAFEEWQDKADEFTILIDEENNIDMTVAELVKQTAAKAFNAGWEAAQEHYGQWKNT